VVKWVGLESLFGSTGFDKMVDKDVEAEELGEWGDIAKWRCDGGKGWREDCSPNYLGRINDLF
jgi:hypothetical protein